MVHQLVGKCEFKDERNGFSGYYILGQGGPTKNSPKDYLTGEIFKDGVLVSKIRGNYMGYLDFDGVRYFDGRDMNNIESEPINVSATCT
jgi:hypothetical protein